MKKDVFVHKEMEDDNNIQVVNKLKTVLDFIRWGATQFEKNKLFYGHGAENSWDDASLLVLSCLHICPDQYADVLICRLTADEKLEIVEKIQIRITTRKPVSYITKEAWFGGMSFYVDERVLVPRSPIAELINNHFSPWLDNVSVKTIADVCTGGGCIACLVANNFPEAKVDALDISKDALAVAKINVGNHGLHKQVNVINSDLMTQVLDKKYDLIISNPPYVANNIVEKLPQEYQHEPKLGLLAGEQGLDLVVPLLKQAKQLLNKDGLLVVEVGSSKNALENYFPQIKFLWMEFTNSAEGVFILSQEELLKIS